MSWRSRPRRAIVAEDASQFLRAFVTPAALCAIVYAIAMATVLQFSVRAYIPGSLNPGGLTLANFAAMLKPLYARVFLDTVWICFLTAFFTLIVSYPLAYALVHVRHSLLKSGDPDHRDHAALSRRSGAYVFVDHRVRQ